MQKAAIRIVLIVLLLILIVRALGQTLPEPHLVSAGLPKYPALARQARIEGEVRVEFTLNSSGEPVSVSAVSGHPMLKGAAEENVKTWKFELPKDLYRTEWKYDTIFNFKFSTDNQPYENPKLSVTIDSYHYVEVITNPPSNNFAHDCPRPSETQPPSSVTERDFVELSRSGCYGTCPSYKVKVAGNGDVSWRGGAFVDAVGERHSTIGSESATALLEKFNSPAFWALCGGYDASVTDSSTMQIEVRIGGRSKTVCNYANSAPQFEKSLEDAVDAAANTHGWRHGDARTEPLSNILQDAYMPKLGVTPLMKADAEADLSAIKEILISADDVDATDGSGWTALMYAAASGHSEPVELLLAAKANPNHKSLNGDTPLMASAISRLFDQNLAHAGAALNAKNSFGTTALMILAAAGEADEVRDALKAGADATLKDSMGRAALDYLHLANCGKSPVPGYSAFTTGEKCDELDEDDVREVAALLKRASGSVRH